MPVRDNLKLLMGNATEFATRCRRSGRIVPPGAVAIFLDRFERLLRDTPEDERQSERDRLRAVLEPADSK